MSVRGERSGSAWIWGLLALVLIGGRPITAQEVGFHHVHLNVADPSATIAFYQRGFGAQQVSLAGGDRALYTGRHLLLLTEVAEPPPAPTTGIWHIGWGATDVAAKARWLEDLGVELDTPLYRIPGTPTQVTYWRGPDRELIEVNTMRHHRFAHVHLFASDVNATVDWYRRHLGVAPRREQVERPPSYLERRAWSNAFRVDDVSFIVYGAPDSAPAPPWWRGLPIDGLAPSRGTVVDHLAFSFPSIDPVLEQMRKDGVSVLEPIAERDGSGLRSFVVQGPDGVAVEIVEAKPVPGGVWE